ncbi:MULTISPECIES: helix-turn-helix domain-containing protein [Clostridium]|uniref:Helix-turn-helix transcriptional regulator n=2 Tax=Clostridium beijerinckii TaxID=1520 RepID=A0A1S8QVY4_CLOBE|nr:MULTISPECIES: helix-turn-helix domain-containing protein [Clostridium]ABR32474.1 helix-turn-helix- domain containing protein, AraC type [Clostridium beijerinckii NCIMB 8052]AIU02496.1 helix-turn-helix domain-containing protein [Clostridium beijerinckii ATCC 35702]MBE6088244.1 helix-turn-helix domain-containing protein [Clostridium beijerinckii]MBF7807847.1 helix-turn-helix transcriptional regulator [Clostridium beijerinckii]NOW88465.1 AraC-like DNA-binding protein [Clostridium beijerinckii]
MDNSFISDMSIFNNDISFLIKLRAKPQILEIVKKKHLDEISDEISIQDKKNDLLIWNAMYTREIVENGILTRYLHPIYNKFYTLIPTLNTIDDLQTIEIQMIDTYINLLINDVEVKDNFVINRILKHLHLNIESQISLKKLSGELNLSEGYISDCFKKHMGMTIMKYAKKIRIDRAKVLLVTTTSSILEIGLTLGFHDQSHFHKVFKSFTGVSPSEYRNNNFG